MSVGIVIVTHGDTGASLIEEASFILGDPGDIRFVSFNRSEALDSSASEIRSSIEQAETGDGVLVLADLIGASPSNLTAALIEDYKAIMVTGINLAMLVSVLNYRDKPLEILVKKAFDAGSRSIKIIQK